MSGGLLLTATGLGHRFGREWLFKDLSLHLEPGASLAITGPNGSGKSTLLRILAGQLSPEVGAVMYQADGMNIAASQWYRYLSWAGPAVELYPALTILDTLQIHYRFKRLRLSSLEQWLEITQLSHASHQPVGALSSGQRQRMLLALALFADTPLLLLDEPTANFDAHWRNIALGWLQEYAKGRTLILASNLPMEYATIAQQLHL